MPRLFSRLPVSLHAAAITMLTVTAVVCAIAAIVSFGIYSETTETTGHLWWKETREIPFGERRPYQLAGIGFAVAATSLLIGGLELVASALSRSYADRQRDRETAKARHLWEMSPAGQAERQAQAAAAARRRWEQSTAGQATLAYQRGDHYFSIELVVDGDLAQDLNEISMAGWRQESVGRRHEKTTSQRPLSNGTHEVTRETVEYRTYLFRRNG